MIGKNIRSIKLDSSVKAFYKLAFKDNTFNILNHGLKRYKIILQAAFEDKTKIYNENLRNKMKIFIGENDSIIKETLFEDIYKQNFVYNEGEHDWLVSNPKESKKFIESYIN